MKSSDQKKIQKVCSKIDSLISGLSLQLPDIPADNLWTELLSTWISEFVCSTHNPTQTYEQIKELTFHKINHIIEN